MKVDFVETNTKSCSIGNKRVILWQNTQWCIGEVREGVKQKTSMMMQCLIKSHTFTVKSLLVEA